MDKEIPDMWHYFEIMDRSTMICSQIDTAFTDHPGLDAKHIAMIEQASALIGEVYQWAGQELDKASKNDKDTM